MFIVSFNHHDIYAEIIKAISMFTWPFQAGEYCIMCDNSIVQDHVVLSGSLLFSI